MIIDEPTIYDQLRSFSGSRKKVRLTRSIPSEPTHNGFVVGLSVDWVLFHQFHDFFPDGYTILRVDDITALRAGPYERQWERMLAAEGLLQGAAPRADIELGDIASLLKSLMALRENVILQCEDDEEDIEDFYIGKILSVGDKSVRFASFDALGSWDDEAHVILFDEITRLQIETPYSRTFSKYVDPYEG